MASLLSVSFCLVTRIIAEIVRLAFSFLIAWFEKYADAFLRVIHMGIESGEILAQRPQLEPGGTKGKISELS
jgi:hypothetical protein